MSDQYPIDPDKLSDSAKQLLANKTFRFTAPVFDAYNIPNGFLVRDMACHGLFYYAITARRAFEENVQGWGLQYEGNLSNTTNFRALFESIAFLYGVSPANMVKFWKEVDMQFHVLGIPSLPDEDRYRHNKTPEIKLQ